MYATVNLPIFDRTQKQRYMWKQITSTLLLGCLLFTSCKETDHTVNEATNEKMRAELKETYPSLLNSQIRIQVKDFQDVTVLLGDKQLFAASDDSLQKVADHIGQMVVEMYLENNYLNEGKLTIIEAERTMPSADDVKKEFDLKLEERIEAMEKK